MTSQVSYSEALSDALNKTLAEHGISPKITCDGEKIEAWLSISLVHASVTTLCLDNEAITKDRLRSLVYHIRCAIDAPYGGPPMTSQVRYAEALSDALERTLKEHGINPEIMCEREKVEAWHALSIVHACIATLCLDNEAITKDRLISLSSHIHSAIDVWKIVHLRNEAPK